MNSTQYLIQQNNMQMQMQNMNNQMLTYGSDNSSTVYIPMWLIISFGIVLALVVTFLVWLIWYIHHD